MLYRFIILVLFVSTWHSSMIFAQEVQISKGFSIRNDFSYELLGKIDERILMFRDRGLSYELEIFDEDLKHIDTRELQFKKRKVNILGLVPQDTVFTVFYSYRNDGLYHIRARSFNDKGRVQDTSSIIISDSREFFRNPIMAFSERYNKSMLFNYEKGSQLNVMVIDNASKEIDWDDQIYFDDFELLKDLRTMLLSEEGGIFILLEKDNVRIRRKKHFLELCYLPPDSKDLIQHRFTIEDKLTTDVKMVYDKENDRINIVGLYNDKNKQDAEGYYYMNANVSELTNPQKATMVPFTPEFIAEVYGQKVGRNERLKHFNIADVKYRADGGLIVMMEMQKAYSRRTGFNQGGFASDPFAARGWTDHYNEDIVLLNLNADGSELWKEHLHKKQFSQDDDGVFSSFYTFLTPSRLRLLYNDEIKRNSTVSEYVISPVGEYKRNAVLSTDDQNIKLRFQDALQVSSTSLLVPSERSFELSLVKITY